jgi:PhnB protein
LEIRPYLIFKGECQAAINLYERAFDTRVNEIQRFSDMPENLEDPMPIPEDMKDWILMATLPMGDNFIRLSDTIGELKDAESERVTIAVELEVNKVKKAFDILAEEGSIGIPLQKSFFSPLYGVVHDKYGVMWTLIGQNEE